MSQGLGILQHGEGAFAQKPYASQSSIMEALAPAVGRSALRARLAPTAAEGVSCPYQRTTAEDIEWRSPESAPLSALGDARSKQTEALIRRAGWHDQHKSVWKDGLVPERNRASQIEAMLGCYSCIVK